MKKNNFNKFIKIYLLILLSLTNQTNYGWACWDWIKEHPKTSATWAIGTFTLCKLAFSNHFFKEENNNLKNKNTELNNELNKNKENIKYLEKNVLIPAVNILGRLDIHNKNNENNFNTFNTYSKISIYNKISNSNEKGLSLDELKKGISDIKSSIEELKKNGLIKNNYDFQNFKN